MHVYFSFWIEAHLEKKGKGKFYKMIEGAVKGNSALDFEQLLDRLVSAGAYLQEHAVVKFVLQQNWPQTQLWNLLYTSSSLYFCLYTKQ